MLLVNFSEYHLDHLDSVLKDELNSIPMEEFVGLRRNCYAFLCTGG